MPPISYGIGCLFEYTEYLVCLILNIQLKQCPLRLLLMCV